MQTLEELIAGAAVFASLTPSQLELVGGCAVNQRVQRDAYLLREGDPADSFFFIRSGSVALEIHRPGQGPIVIETLYPGEVVGWSWLFAPFRWQLDARAVEPCALVTFDGLCLRGKCQADHELGYQLMSQFAANLVGRLQATRLQVLDVYGHAHV